MIREWGRGENGHNKYVTNGVAIRPGQFFAGTCTINGHSLQCRRKYYDMLLSIRIPESFQTAHARLQEDPRSVKSTKAAALPSTEATGFREH